MEDGSLRADINVSVHRNEKNSHRVEIKNLNSLRSIERAVKFERERLEKLLDLSNSESIDFNETRSFDVKKGITIPMREKETDVDYRFMFDPDIPPLYVSKDRISDIEKKMKELPDQIKRRLSKEFHIRSSEIEILLANPGLRLFFEGIMLDTKCSAPTVANLVCNTLLGAIRKQYGDEIFDNINRVDLIQILDLIENKRLSTQRAKDLILDFVVKGQIIDWETEISTKTNHVSQEETREFKFSKHPP